MISLLLVLPALAGEADWDALNADGWEMISTSKNDVTGEIEVSLRYIAGTACLRGEVVVDVPPDTLFEVVTDIPGALEFSSETMLASRNLGQPGQHEYYQHLDVPNWTMASDRYWVLRGEDRTVGEVRSFRWDRFDWKTAYPELAAELAKDHASAIEPQVNWGDWTFTPHEGRTNLVYRLCNDPGGSLPQWLQKAAATKTLPNSIVDIVREGLRRK